MTPILSFARPAPASADPRPLPAIRSRWPSYDEDMIADVAEVLRSGRVNALHHGERCAAFERGFAELCGVPHAVAVANGTVALELALRALGIGAGHEVVVPARSFMASASAVVAVGATPVFADVTATTQGLSARTVADVVTPRTRCILVVHLAGWPAPMEEIGYIARSFDLRVVEDCAQAHGATLGNRAVGSFGDAAAFSFCTDKIISTGGEGGMVVTPHEPAWRTAWAYKDHGKSPDPDATAAGPGTFRWLHRSIGSNMRLTEMQAAIGLRQLGSLPHLLARRRQNAAILDDALAGLPALRLTIPPAGVGHAYYKYYCFVRPTALAAGWSRDRIMAELHARGVPCGSGACPEIYMEPAFHGTPHVPPRPLPMARALGRTSLMLPVDPTLSPSDMADMAARIRSVVVAATR